MGSSTWLMVMFVVLPLFPYLAGVVDVVVATDPVSEAAVMIRDAAAATLLCSPSIPFAKSSASALPEWLV